MKKDIFAQEKQRFSIRKYSFGAASVLIGASLVFAGQVAADETGTAKSNSTEPVTVQVSTPTTESSTADQTATLATPVAQADHAETTVKAVEAAVGTDIKSTVSSDSSASAKAEVTTSTDTVTDTASTAGDVSEVSTSQVDSSVASEKTTSEDTEVSNDAAKITVSNSAQTNVAVEDLLREAKVATTASVSEDRAAVAEKKLPTTGYYTYPERTEVKNTPTVAAPVEFYVNAGDRVFYDKVLTNDGYQWLSYKSYSGIRRYAAITKLTADKPVAAPTGQLSFQNQTPQGFDVLVTNVSDSNGIAAVKVPVWTDKSGQDDLIWYNAAKQANGDYKVAVKVSDHKNELGDYNVHLYYIESTGKMVGVTGTKTTVTNEVPQSGLNLPSQGSYTFTSRVEVKSQPKMSAPTEFTFDKGEKINYDKVLDADSHQWISYVSYSGTRRYIPIALSTQPVKPAIERTGKLTIDSQNNGDFNVVVSEVSDPNGIAEVKVPVWTDKSGQDDLVWYDAAKQSDGTYKVAVKLSDHKNERGIYNVHLYYIDKTGKMSGVTATQTTVAQPKDERTGTLSIQNQSNGDFNVIVSNVSDSNGIAGVKVPVWTDKSGQDDLVWYDATKQSDGTYKAAVKLSDHKNERGIYNVHLYYIDKTGSKHGVTATQTTVAQPKDERTGTLSIQNQSNGDFNVIVSNVSDSNGIAEVKVPVWTDKSGQDDLVWYDAAKQSDGTYKVAVKLSDHKNERGTYNVHLYYIDKTGSKHGVTATQTTVAQPVVEKNKLSIENKTSKGFDVIVSNLSFSTPVTQVKVPVWSSQSGQDDLVWYDATKQSNGNYKVSVSVSNHKNSSGEYNVHLYYLDNTGKMNGIAGTTTTVETSNAEPVFNGSYYSIKGKYDDIIVVNKKYPLSATYNPGENATAKEAFTRLRNDMITQGLNVGYGYSGFRSYSTQANLYQNYVNRDGQAAADRYSARPGYSEHQTGLAYDLTDKAGNLLEDARASQWLKDNAHNYGFVVRYQPGKEASTGFMEEAWHVRYIGKEAKEVHDSGLTLEEYFGFQGGDYGNVSPAQPSQPTNTGNNLPAQGTYTFTKNCPIKAEPNNASPIITYYPAGDKVNYTSVLNNDGHVWLAYRTYSGAQRYVAID
ncbi:LD-carboxypeptidase LdcB/DacB [Streptococcus sp. FT1-55]|uniref:LD-carboxypeptidase LdcB/DacB n=1 Tax=Streptococcus sp. FT1-55 TaxID=3409805 RepID=UPI003BF515EE